MIRNEHNNIDNIPDYIQRKKDFLFYSAALEAAQRYNAFAIDTQEQEKCIKALEEELATNSNLATEEKQGLICRIFVLRLFINKMYDTEALGNDFDMEMFENACSVFMDLVYMTETGKKHERMSCLVNNLESELTQLEYLRANTKPEFAIVYNIIISEIKYALYRFGPNKEENNAN